MKNNRARRTNKCKPCKLCGNKRITEVILPNGYSFMMCEKCNISTDAGATTNLASMFWNKVMEGTNMKTKETPLKKYDKKCRFVNFRFRKDTDKKYLDFLDNCENKTAFLRNAIDNALQGK